MNRSLITLLLGLAAPLAETCAQVQVPVNPKATYLGIANDAGALPAPGIPLNALGLAPGAWVSISTVGAYRYAGGADSQRNLIAVFSSSSQLLTPVNGLVNRVPGAIPVVHGAAITTGNTASFNQPTNIPEDFVISRTGWSNGAVVQVPAGAAFLFLSVFGTGTTNQFGGNSDPNNDYFAVFTPTPPATLQGTAEHCELLTGVGATPSATPDVKPATPFATVSVECAQRFGMSTGEVFLIGANVFVTGNAPPVGPLPDLHMGLDAQIVQVGVMTSAPGLWSLFVPPGFPGTTVVVQGFFLSPSARNGFLSASNAHRIELQ